MSCMNDGRNIMAGMPSACEALTRQAPLAEAVIKTFEYVASEIKAGRFIGHRKYMPKSVVLHKCKFSIEAIRMLELTAETRLFALRVLDPSAGRVERELFPIIADLLLADTENPPETRSQAAGKPEAVP